jgi:hypothetical protein
MKPGYLTTEFWLTIVVGVLTNLGTIEVPDRFKPLVTLGLVVGYAISRGLAKYESPAEPLLPVVPVNALEVENADQAATVAAKSTAKKPARKRS